MVRAAAHTVMPDGRFPSVLEFQGDKKQKKKRTFLSLLRVEVASCNRLQRIGGNIKYTNGRSGLRFATIAGGILPVERQRSKALQVCCIWHALAALQALA